MESRNDDYQLLPKFFECPQVDQEKEIDFPLPRSAADLQTFLNSQHGKRYKQKFITVIKTISDWAKHQQLNTNNLDIFARQYLAYTGSNMEQNLVCFTLYTEGVIALANIATLLSNPAVSNKKTIIENFIKDVLSCGPGTHTHIINTYLELKSKLNLPTYFMKIRRKIAEQAIIDDAYEFEQGMEIHYVNAILNNLSFLLNIDKIEDEYIEDCDTELIEEALGKLLGQIHNLYSLENILATILADTGYECIAEEVNKSGYHNCLDFIERLSFFGKEENVIFLYTDDFISSDEDYTSFEVAWSAPYVLILSILHRLYNQNYVSLNYIEQSYMQHKFYLLMDSSLRLAFVTIENPTDQKYHQPLLTYLVRQVIAGNVVLLDYLLKNPLISSLHKIELLSAFADYYAGLKTIKQFHDFENVLRILITKFSIDQFLQLSRNQFRQKGLTSFTIPNILKYIDGIDTRLANIFDCLPPESISPFVNFLYSRGLNQVSTESIVSNLARLGYHHELGKLFSNFPHRVNLQAKHLALFRACAMGHIAIVQLIISDPKIDINKTHLHNCTPLIIAIKNRHADIANILIENGASPYIVSRQGHSPLYLAVKYNLPSVVINLLSKHSIASHPNLLEEGIIASYYEICVILLRHHFPIDYEAISDFIHDIIARNDLETAKILLQRLNKRYLNVVTDEVGTPLYHAVKLEHYELAQLFLQNGARVNGRNQYIPLFMAVEKNNDVMIKLLLDFNANPNKTLNNISCLQYALNLNRHDYFRIFLVQNKLIELNVTPGGLCDQVFRHFRLQASNHIEHFGTLLDLFSQLAVVSQSTNDDPLLNSINDMYLYYLKNNCFTSQQLNALLLQCKLILTSLEHPPLSTQIFQLFISKNTEFENRIRDLIMIIEEQMRNILNDNSATNKRAKH